MSTFPSIDFPESADLLFSLLPGLVTYLVKHSLTSRHIKIETVDAVLWGLAYTIIVHGVWSLLKLGGPIIPTPDIVGLPATAVAVGFAAAIISNTEIFYKLLRDVGATRLPSQATTWHSAFADFRYGRDGGEYAVFHMKDGRRLLGAIVSYSHAQKEGHIYLMKFSWIGGDAESQHNRTLLVNSEDVQYVEFIPLADRHSDSNENSSKNRGKTSKFLKWLSSAGVEASPYSVAAYEEANLSDDSVAKH